MMFYKGHWSEGIRYRENEAVTHKGLLWGCSAETVSRPGTTKQWSMLSKRRTVTILGIVSADNGGLPTLEVQLELLKYIEQGAAEGWPYLHGRAAHDLAQLSESLRKEVKALRDGLE